MKDLMTDLETRGTVPGCAILSIGAVRLDPITGELGDEFYVVVNRQSCLDAGLHEDKDTMRWWAHQDGEARKVLDQSEDPTVSVLLAEALAQFNTFVKQKPGTRVYGNGADFDNPILSVAYRSVGMKQGWAPYNGRCYRTLKSVFKDPPMAKREGTYHNALDDAKNQASHLIALANQHSLVLA